MYFRMVLPEADPAKAGNLFPIFKGFLPVFDFFEVFPAFYFERGTGFVVMTLLTGSELILVWGQDIIYMVLARAMAHFTPDVG